MAKIGESNQQMLGTASPPEICAVRQQTMKKTFTMLTVCCLMLATCINNGLAESIPACAVKADAKAFFPPAMAEKKFTGPVNGLHRGCGTNSLLVLDDKFLFDLNTTNFKRKSIQIREEKDYLANLWTPKNFAVSADRNRILILDKVINTETRQVEKVLDVKSVITTGNPSPEAFSISPNGRMGLVFVHSYSSDEFDCLAVFDLETGKVKHVTRNANSIRYAIFCSDDQMAVFYTNGVISMQTPDGKEAYKLSDNGPIPVPWGGHAITLGTLKRPCLVVSDGMKLVVFDLISRNRVFEDTDSSHPIATSDKSILAYEAIRSSGKLCGCGKHELSEVVLKCMDLESNGMLEIVMPKAYNHMFWDRAAEVLYCGDSDILSKIPLRASELKRMNRKMSNQVPEDKARKLAYPQH